MRRSRRAGRRAGAAEGTAAVGSDPTVARSKGSRDGEARAHPARGACAQLRGWRETLLRSGGAGGANGVGDGGAGMIRVVRVVGGGAQPYDDSRAFAMRFNIWTQFAVKDFGVLSEADCGVVFKGAPRSSAPHPPLTDRAPPHP